MTKKLPPTKPRRHAPGTCLLMGALLGGCSGFLGGFLGGYLYYSMHRDWAFGGPFGVGIGSKLSMGVSNGIFAAFVLSVAGGFTALIVLMQCAGRRIGMTSVVVFAAVSAVVGFVNSVQVAHSLDRAMENFAEGPLASCFFAATTGALAWSAFRYWFNRNAEPVKALPNQPV